MQRIALLAAAAALLAPGAHAFAAPGGAPKLRGGGGGLIAAREHGRRRPQPTVVGTARMCICVNCKLVDVCKAYHFVEEKHQQPHLTETPAFEPRDGNPTIEAIIRKEPADTPRHLADRGITAEYDVVACEDFVHEEGRWRKMMPKGTLLVAGFDPDFVPT
eukprot:Tamp_31925.p2 GENE.Tamp_31925~~Tamp_31925.p2  ORF type:complete len:161 (+),score=39.77 Tamp_31925:3-485(+)